MPGAMSLLALGTYYLFLLGSTSGAYEARCLGRMVGVGDRLACVNMGMEVKELVQFGDGRKEPPGSGLTRTRLTSVTRPSFFQVRLVKVGTPDCGFPNTR